MINKKKQYIYDLILLRQQINKDINEDTNKIKKILQDNIIDLKILDECNFERIIQTCYINLDDNKKKTGYYTVYRLKTINIIDTKLKNKLFLNFKKIPQFIKFSLVKLNSFFETQKISSILSKINLQNDKKKEYKNISNLNNQQKNDKKDK